MKLNSFLCVLAVSLVATFEVTAAVSFTGAYSTNLKQSDGTTNIATGTRYIVVVDTAGNGFGGSTNGSIADGTSLTTGSLFGGDEIIQSSTVGGVAGRAPTAVSNLNIDVAPYAGKQFAIYWFESLTGTSATDGSDYGFYRDTDWIVPAVAGSYGFSSTPTGTDFLQNTAAQTAGLTVGAAPEPSRALLLGIGALGFMMRRRRK